MFLIFLPIFYRSQRSLSGDDGAEEVAPNGEPLSADHLRAADLLFCAGYAANGAGGWCSAQQQKVPGAALPGRHLSTDEAKAGHPLRGGQWRREVHFHCRSTGQNYHGGLLSGEEVATKMNSVAFLS